MFKMIKVSLLCLLIILAVGLNSVCIFVLYNTKSTRNRPSMFLLLSLLIIHLLQGIVVFPLYVGKVLNIGSEEWKLIFCNGYRFTYMVTYYTAVLNVLCIGMDRLLATWCVLKYKHIASKRNVLCSIGLLWIYVVSLCILPFFTETTNNGYMNSTTQNNSYSSCTYKQTELWTSFMLLIYCTLPYLLIVACYKLIIYRVNLIKNNARHTRSIDYNKTIIINEEVRKHHLITRLSCILSVVYIFFWSPSVIYYLLQSFCKGCFNADYEDSITEQTVGFIVKYLAFSDSVAAPLIYCFYHKDFRKLISEARKNIKHLIYFNKHASMDIN